MRLFVLAWLVLMTAVHHSFAQTLAMVGGMPITLAQVEAADPDPSTRMRTLVMLIDRQAVLNDAIHSGVTKTPAYAAEIEQARINITLNIAIQTFIASHPVSDQQVADVYARLFTHPPKQYRLREILTDDFAGANAAIARLQRGEDFSVLAAQVSQDPSAALGGELGWQTLDQMPAPLMQALKSLSPLQAAGPIALPQGYAVIQLLGSRPMPRPSVAEVKAKIITAIQQQSLNAHIEMLRAAQHAVLLTSASAQ